MGLGIAKRAQGRTEHQRSLCRERIPVPLRSYVKKAREQEVPGGPKLRRKGAGDPFETLNGHLALPRTYAHAQLSGEPDDGLAIDVFKVL